MQTVRDSGIFSVGAFDAINKLGYDSEKIFNRCGLDGERLRDKNLRTPHAGQQLFWQIVERETGDPHIGLHLGQHLPVLRGHIMEYLFMTSKTFGIGLEQINRYFRLLSDGVMAELIVEGENAYLAYQVTCPMRHSIECGTLCMINFLKEYSDGLFKPTAIHFPHASTLSEEDYATIFDCPVHLNQTESRIYFDSELLNFHSPHAEPELFQLHTEIANNRLNKLEKQDLIADVHEALAELLGDDMGGISLKMVAQKLSMNPRQLRFRLDQAGTNFNAITNEYRCRLAKKLLRRPDQGINTIVYQTGFSEASTFYRAFKRWTGMTPIKYRQQKQGEHSSAFA